MQPFMHESVGWGLSVSLVSAVSEESKAHVHMWVVCSMSQLRDCWILEGRRKLGLRASGSGWRELLTIDYHHVLLTAWATRERTR